MPQDVSARAGCTQLAWVVGMTATDARPPVKTMDAGLASAVDDHPYEM